MPVVSNNEQPPADEKGFVGSVSNWVTGIWNKRNQCKVCICCVIYLA